MEPVTSKKSVMVAISKLAVFTLNIDIYFPYKVIYYILLSINIRYKNYELCGMEIQSTSPVVGVLSLEFILNPFIVLFSTVQILKSVVPFTDTE